MFSSKIINLIILSFCFFDSAGKNMNNSTIYEKMDKPVSSFIRTLNGVAVETFFYTTELSRILLVGEPKVFETIRALPLINVMTLAAPIFDNRFEKFIKISEKHSQNQLLEAILDATILTSYNTNAYSVSKLLDHLSTALQNKIDCIMYQIKHDSKWDQKSLNSFKKYSALAIGLTAFIVITNKYIGTNNIENKVSNLEGLNATAVLSLLPVSYYVLKNCYKVLTINHNANTDNLSKYEELLSFVQKLKNELKTYGSISITLRNGNIATIENNTVKFN